MSRFGIHAVRLAAAAFAAAMIIYGVSRGELAVIVNRAVNLCFECIGLG